MATVQTTTLNRHWVLKMSAFLILLAGFGTWGLVDGLWVYPNRGEIDASYKLYRYLEAARDAGRLTQADVAVAEPRAALSGLEGREHELLRAAQGQGTGGGVSSRMATFELARLAWLRSLKNVWRLDEAPSRLEGDLSAQLTELTATWKTTSPPKPLDAFDLFFQWVFVALGYGGAVWVGVVMVRAKGVRYTWAAEEHRLTLPDGKSITPADIAEFDKRKWHKFYITILFKDGTSRTLDLLRHVPLEEWILAMEKIVNPEAAGEAAAGSGEGEGGGPEPVGAAEEAAADRANS